MRTLIKAILIITAFLGFLFITGCKMQRVPDQAEVKYSVQGEWRINREYFPNIKSIICVFTGNKESGTVMPEEGESGYYSVGGEHGDEIRFSFSYYEDGVRVVEDFKGKFSTENNMSGTFTTKYGDILPLGELFWGANRN
jgi:hypothetical protein